MRMTCRTTPFILCASLAQSLHVNALPEIEVTAPRAAAPDSPFSHTTQEEDLDAAATASPNFLDLLPAVPNAYVSGDFSLGFTLRGLGQESMFSTGGTTSNPLITATRDGIPLSYGVLTYLPPLATDLDRLEVANGPQIVAPGASSLGGALRFTSPHPEFSFAGQAALSAGDYGFRRAYLSQNLVILPDELALRFSSHWEESDGHLENITYGDHHFAAIERQRHTATLLWKPGFGGEDTVVLNAGYDGSRGNSLGNTLRVAGLISNELDGKTARNTEPAFPADHWFGSLKGNFSLGNDLTLTSLSTLQRFDLGRLLDLDSSPFLNWFAKGYNNEFRFTQDLLLEQQGDTLDWTLGTYFESSRYVTGNAGVGIFPFPGGSPFSTTLDEDVTKFAVFGNLNWNLSPAWRISGGLRALHERREVDASTQFLLPNRYADDRTSEDAILPELGVHWTGHDKVEAGLRVSRGHRAGGVAYAQTLAVARPYGEETSWDAELYVDYKPRKDLAVSLNVFASLIDDQQVPFTPAGGTTVLDQLIANSSSSRRYGAEIESRWKISESFTGHAGLGWLHTEYRDLQLQGADFSGSKFSNAPELTASVGLAFHHPTGWFASSRFTWADTSFTTLQDAAVTNLETRKLLSARVGYAWENISVHVFGNNLLDDRYATARMVGLAVPSMNADIGAPRVLGIGCEVRW
jgi:iron complex outermembrane receptor protein